MAKVHRLRARAAEHVGSAEAEHRANLDVALRYPGKRSLAQVLSQMPNVGKDEDFVRPIELMRQGLADVFD
ncbi:hypothetical protein S2091_3707 [Solimicrobium silvestre]|uniref:Uncharacterized protein n=2 Tax=Solimicrobium silvestre TaxID=2099400 RepID=A0A2S9GV57_9BURK|nr:hypothetical protein S2091_3707 [Solimicrobium silvestre]